MTPAPTFAFGAYLFIPGRQRLLRNGEVVRVGGRALDLLTAFVRRPGELLTKRELIAEAWPSTTVVEGNLKVHIAALRRVLDDDADSARYIATVNGRGYRFIAPVETGEAAASPSPRPLVCEVELAAQDPARIHFEEVVALVARTMRSTVLDVPGEPTKDAVAGAPRRVLFIELTARDEAWIEDVFARRGAAISATR